MLHVSEVQRSDTICVLRRAQLNHALTHLFQPSLGRLNEPCLRAACSDHTSKTNRALGVKHAWARLSLPSVSTTLFSRIPHTWVCTCPHPHSVAWVPRLCRVSTRKVHVILLWSRLWTLSITCFSITNYKIFSIKTLMPWQWQIALVLYLIWLH